MIPLFSLYRFYTYLFYRIIAINIKDIHKKSLTGIDEDRNKARFFRTFAKDIYAHARARTHTQAHARARAHTHVHLHEQNTIIYT